MPTNQQGDQISSTLSSQKGEQMASPHTNHTGDDTATNTAIDQKGDVINVNLIVEKKGNDIVLSTATKQKGDGIDTNLPAGQKNNIAASKTIDQKGDDIIIASTTIDLEFNITTSTVNDQKGDDIAIKQKSDGIATSMPASHKDDIATSTLTDQKCDYAAICIPTYLNDNVASSTSTKKSDSTTISTPTNQKETKGSRAESKPTFSNESSGVSPTSYSLNNELLTPSPMSSPLFCRKPNTSKRSLSFSRPELVSPYQAPNNSDSMTLKQSQHPSYKAYPSHIVKAIQGIHALSGSDSDDLINNKKNQTPSPQPGPSNVGKVDSHGFNSWSKEKNVPDNRSIRSSSSVSSVSPSPTPDRRNHRRFFKAAIPKQIKFQNTEDNYQPSLSDPSWASDNFIRRFRLALEREQCLAQEARSNQLTNSQEYKHLTSLGKMTPLSTSSPYPNQRKSRNSVGSLLEESSPLDNSEPASSYDKVNNSRIASLSEIRANSHISRTPSFSDDEDDDAQLDEKPINPKSN